MKESTVGNGVSFKKISPQMVTDIRDLQETGSVTTSIDREQVMLDRIKTETGQTSESLAKLL